MPEPVLMKSDLPISEMIYSVKERRMVAVTNPELIKLKSNVFALRGKCPHSGVRCYKIISLARAKNICPELGDGG